MTHDESHDAIVLELARIANDIGQLRLAVMALMQRIEKLEQAQPGRAPSRWTATEPPVYFGPIVYDELGSIGEG